MLTEVIKIMVVTFLLESKIRFTSEGPIPLSMESSSHPSLNEKNGLYVYINLRIRCYFDVVNC